MDGDIRSTSLERFQIPPRKPSRRYSLSTVRIRAVISTAVPTDATAKNILGMRATMVLDPRGRQETALAIPALEYARNLAPG